MYKILLCCSAGLTSSMLVASMKTEAENNDLDVLIWSVAKTAISFSWADADCVLVAPQIASALPEIQKMVQGKIPVELINSEDFSSMNGKVVLEFAIQLIEK